MNLGKEREGLETRDGSETGFGDRVRKLSPNHPLQLQARLQLFFKFGQKKLFEYNGNIGERICDLYITFTDYVWRRYPTSVTV